MIGEIAFGWGMVSSIDGQPSFDQRGLHFPEAALTKAAAKFMSGTRRALANHEGDEVGKVIFAFPLTAEVAKAFGLNTRKTGLMIGMQIENADTLAKCRDGDLTGFSYGIKYYDNQVQELTDGK